MPGAWSEALKILRKNHANSVVISAFADVMHYTVVIITVHGVNYCLHFFTFFSSIALCFVKINFLKSNKLLCYIFILQDENFVKVVKPHSGPSIGTLYFGHSGNHYVALKPKQKVRSVSFIYHTQCKQMWFISEFKCTNFRLGIYNFWQTIYSRQTSVVWVCRDWVMTFSL